MSGYVMELRKVVGSRPLILAGAGVIVVDQTDRILLVHRSDNGCWGIPGGYMEEGESFEDTARREVFEETGLVVGELKLLCLHSGPHTFYEYPNGHQVYLAGAIYTTTEFEGELRADKDESVEVRWFHPHEIPPNIHQNDSRVIQTYIHSCVR
jgi:ADP-ribose pyrophosphatase YjhB (NUDIX family)